MTNRSLCDDCVKADGLSSVLGGIREAKCFYCGDKAMGGSMNQAWEFPSRQQFMHYTCMRCGDFYHRFFLEALTQVQGVTIEGQDA
jgi:hypothetical protein